MKLFKVWQDWVVTVLVIVGLVLGDNVAIVCSECILLVMLIFPVKTKNHI